MDRPRQHNYRTELIASLAQIRPISWRTCLIYHLGRGRFLFRLDDNSLFGPQLSGHAHRPLAITVHEVGYQTPISFGFDG